MTYRLQQTLVAAVLTLPCTWVAAADHSHTADNAGNMKMNNAYVVSDRASVADAGTAGSATRVADREFVDKAARSGNAEVELSQLALQTSKNQRVRQFAEQMVADHTTASAELKALAARLGITLPSGSEAAHKKVQDQLARLDNKRFDAAYLDQMIADHEQAVVLFRQQAEHGRNPDLRAWAGKILPHLQEHQQLARDIRQQL